MFSSGSSVYSNLATGYAFHYPPIVTHLLKFCNLLSFSKCQKFVKILQMIDVYWTVIPVMLVHYFASHPLGHYNKLRSMIVVILTWIWSIRLTHNYFRRENWEWGAREDWRFNDLRKQYGKRWWWLSFFSVYVSQQVILPTNCSMNCLNKLVFLVFLVIFPLFIMRIGVK